MYLFLFLFYCFRLDADHSGQISLDNLRHVLGDSYGGLLVEEILAQCDIKKNGVIEFDEVINPKT